MITNEHIEAWLLRYAENELDAEEAAAVEAWLQTHPEWAEVLAGYDPDFRLPGADGIRCPVKDKLLREPQPKVRFAAWWKYAAVAAVLLLVAVTHIVLFRTSPQPAEAYVAEQQVLPAVPEDTAGVRAVEKDENVRNAWTDAAGAPVLAAASDAGNVSGNVSGTVSGAAEQRVEAEEVLLTRWTASDEDAFSDPEVEYIVRERPGQGDAAQVTYTIYTDRLLEVEPEEESRPQPQPNLRQYVFGKVSDFVLKKIKENQ